jgi:adenylate cyclase
MQGDVDIRVPLNKGIAGFVAQTGEIVNISDCYEDDRFDRSSK